MSDDPHADPDMLRVVPPPCQHTWKWVDTHDLWYCPLCRRTESDDDDPGDDDGRAA